MIKVSKKSQYGLRAMVLLAKNYNSKKCQVLSTKYISEKEGVPFDFLEKIISQMERAGLVKGRKGVQGGYMLSRSPAKITTEDIVSVLEGKEKTVDCSLCGKSRKCLTKNVWKKIDIAINKTLESITLSNLIK
jgi:Rrf2 family protein